MAEPYHQVMGILDELSERYMLLMKMYLKHGYISPELVVEEKEPIAAEIIKILFEKGELNISEIERVLREKRGAASRKTIRERLKSLSGDGVVGIIGETGRKKYRISDDLTRKWLEMLGIMK